MYNLRSRGGRSIGTRVSEGGWAQVRTPRRTAWCFGAQHFLRLRRPSPFLVP
ncbi:hypothetical protein EXIGLDRAFT_725144 [Exidia glandulosa HHB12029]|uniref:Uncharacterized protein n=1 Tax=Exidia glandulosa HHB12029 TaxID=1314781 RepID=A0A165E5X9_EXIGL|nr:hypothetical protein EXIGLDRAFT_725144 [Exidia glandulosa HHB12029]